MMTDQLPADRYIGEATNPLAEFLLTDDAFDEFDAEVNPIGCCLMVRSEYAAGINAVLKLAREKGVL